MGKLQVNWDFFNQFDIGNNVSRNYDGEVNQVIFIIPKESNDDSNKLNNLFYCLIIFNIT